MLTKNDLKNAAAIQAAFGPCTSVGECMEVQGIAERAQTMGSWSEFARAQLEIEDIMAERDSVDSDAPYKAWKKAEKGIKARLRALGCKF